jgi:hypothetical protein
MSDWCFVRKPCLLRFPAEKSGVPAYTPEKARVTFPAELAQAIEKKTSQRRNKEKDRAALGGLALGVVVGAMGMLGGLWVVLRFGIGQ